MHSTSDQQAEAAPGARVREQGASIELLQNSAGNQAVSRLLSSAGRNVATAVLPGGVARAVEDQGSAGTDLFVPTPISIAPAGPDPSPMPLNDEGLIDGEWQSEVAATVFVNAGKAGTGVVNWAGGNGGTTPNIGSFTAVAPVIETRPAGDAGTARAWVRAGTGTVTVSRKYFGVPVGANATYFITAAAAARIDTHEQNHIAHSKTAHDAHVKPLEDRVKARTGEAKALSAGADEAAAKTALETELKWNDSLTAFRNQDNTDNLPGGTVDTADAASAGWYHDLGPKTVAGVNYDHFVDV
ncbi:hypothetical protein [Actinocrispum wychmicini]|uniref:hypothetical protein n=1 Tax=Actinocrispum wychmicini TaxID=1213861 RepID=UPI0010485026|nr:hypothetical protein [Actinocrispum wychmicini]